MNEGAYPQKVRDRIRLFHLERVSIMENHLEKMPFAELTPHQLEILQKAENNLNEKEEDVYLIAFRKK